MRVALDTNRYTDLANGVAEAITVLSDADEIVVPFVVIAELQAGFLGGRQQAHNEERLGRFLHKPGTSVVYADDETVRLWAMLRADLKSRGRTMPHNDLWIAAICVQRGLQLYSRDGHFDFVPQVIRV